MCWKDGCSGWVLRHCSWVRTWSWISDAGLVTRDPRSAIRWLVTSAGASCRLVYVPVDHETHRFRIAHRQATTPDQDLRDERDGPLALGRTLLELPDVPSPERSAGRHI
ncbi:AAA family ATPase [Streptomyces massasporeus]